MEYYVRKEDTYEYIECYYGIYSTYGCCTCCRLRLQSFCRMVYGHVEQERGLARSLFFAFAKNAPAIMETNYHNKEDDNMMILGAVMIALGIVMVVKGSGN